MKYYPIALPKSGRLNPLLLAIALATAASLLAFSLPGQTLPEVTLCHTPAADKFALFALNADFNQNHDEPWDYVHVSQSNGSLISFDTPDGKKGTGYLLKPGTPSDRWLFVFQEWWGLNDHIKREAEQFFNDLGNVNVLALDMYDGQVTNVREEASRLMGSFQQSRGNSIVQGALTYVGKKAKIATVGWCFGGGQSMQAALLAGKQAAGCIIYYGMPEGDVNRLRKLNCDVLTIWPVQDQWINKSVIDQFEANMKAAGKKHILKSYEADHAFANPSNPKHNAEMAADAYRHSLDFLKARLK